MAERGESWPEAEPGQTNRVERLFEISLVIASLKGVAILDPNV